MKINTEKQVAGYKLYELPAAPVKELAALSRVAAAEGAVLLKNEGDLLPLKKGAKINLFGRIQFDYFKSGTGSGGLVNVVRVTNILDSLREEPNIEINEELAGVYARWIEDHPFDNGAGWAQEPWCQEEMPLDDETVKKAAEFSDVALVVIGRTAGEDKDNSIAKGSMLLTDTERDMLRRVCNTFDKVCLLLNVGNIIDMSFMDEFSVSSVLYLWQGGQEGGVAAADLLTGRVNPCGKLSDTVAMSIGDYPARQNFGDPHEAKYAEDIYVGYRYFETVAKDRVRYPFGFGLSYTTFDIKPLTTEMENGVITLKVAVTNTGKTDGREVAEVYFSAPQGKLGKPLVQLIAYQKTKLLAPDECEEITFTLDINQMASYDDSGVTGHRFAYVLENGEYAIFVGNSARDIQSAFTFALNETKVVEQLSQAIAPVKDFERMRPALKNGEYVMEYESVPTSEVDLDARIREHRPQDIAYTGDQGIRLIDVADGKASMAQFIAQLSDTDLACLVRGEGMNSPKVTAGTGSAFGGVTDSLLNFGIPVACTTDGPSGIRLDSGAKATAMPNGTCLACTWDDELVERLYVYEGVELFAYQVDALLGPGMNIHRDPLNGRNFEYFSEDPLLTGKTAAAITRGIHQSGPTSTIKHFAANNQEFGRSTIDSVISERALREIYLKGFEIAVKEGGATSVMTTYGGLNGYWTMGNYDLVSTVLRGEWGFDGIVMSDWWAKANLLGEGPSEGNLKQMVRAGNDLFMVCPSSEQYQDNIAEGLGEGYITRGELQKCAENILSYILKAPVFERFAKNGCKVEKTDAFDEFKAKAVAVFDAPAIGEELEFVTDKAG
ncbi:MAG: glycoside hydrolase family 3 C-terminal domain-containing protein, partial [Acutalibacteraceae bacterium]